MQFPMPLAKHQRQREIVLFNSIVDNGPPHLHRVCSGWIRQRDSLVAMPASPHFTTLQCFPIRMDDSLHLAVLAIFNSRPSDEGGRSLCRLSLLVTVYMLETGNECDIG